MARLSVSIRAEAARVATIGLALGAQIVLVWWRSGWEPGVIPGLLVLVTVLALLSWASDRASEAGPRAARHCPELVEIVRSAADTVGVPVPARVGIHPSPVIVVIVHSVPRRRTVVLVGLPLLQVLSADDLRIAVAHQLAVLTEPHPGAALAVAARHEQLEDAPAAVAAGSRKRGLRRSARFVERTAVFATELQLRADQAAVLAAGSAERAALSLLNLALVRLSFQGFGSRFDRLILRRRKVPARLHTGWAETWRSEYLTEGDWRAAEAMLTTSVKKAHPALTGAFDGLRETVRTSPGRPVLGSADPKLERALALAFAKTRLSGNARARATSWEKIDPANVFGPPLTGESSYVEAASALLGHPASAAETVGLLLGEDRPRLSVEFCRVLAAGDPDFEPGDPPEEQLWPTADCVMFVTDALRARGYRHVDALHADRLAAQDGSVVSVYELVRNAVESPEGLLNLQGLLGS